MAVKELSGILSDPGNSVRTLDIGDAAAEGAIALEKLLQASTSLSCLKVQSFDCQADASSAAAVIRGLACNSSLQELCLQGLSAASVKDLASCIAAGPLAGKLQQLRLPCCRLDSTAAGALHDALLATPCLQLLSLQKAVLESNKLKGAEGLAALLRSPAGQSLSTLNLANNCFGDEAASQLAAAAAASSSLTVLDLSCNWIGDEAEQELDSVAAAAAAATAAAAAGQASGMDPALVESLSGWLLEAAGAANVVLPAELLKCAGGGNDSGSRQGKRAVCPAVAAAQLGGSSEDDSSSDAGQNVGRLRVRCRGGGSSSRDGGACSPHFYSCSNGSECGSESGCESESESGTGGEHGSNCNDSRAATPGAAARCAVRKLDSPRSSVVVAKAAAAAAAGGSKRLSRFAAAAQQETGAEAAPHASGATQPLL
ncbi:hypothetical protein OEZ86_014652 [Tetradesmus obliquus]|nr:hypothetical protein OEZ86_014652 [Tetradesmus obliquus]